MSNPSAHSGNTQYIGNMPTGGGGGGGGTPNVAIAGTDASGNPIQSPVLLGNAGLDNITMDGMNTNTGFRATVLGGQNTNGGASNIVAGTSNQVGNGANNGVFGENNEVANLAYQNLMGGFNNEIKSSGNVVGGVANTVEKIGGSADNNLVTGVSNRLTDSNTNAVSGANHLISNGSQQNIVGGNNNTLNNVVNSIVSGYSHDIAPLAGSGADYNDVSGNDHFVRGDYNAVRGGSHNVQGIANDVSGINNIVASNNASVHGSSNNVGSDAANSTVEGAYHVVNGELADVSGEGNKAHFGQIVKGRYAVENVVANDVPTPGQMVEIVGWGADDSTRANIRTLRDDGQEDVAHSYAVAGTKVVGPQEIGWSSPSGVGTKTAFDTSTVTVEQLAERVKALTDALLSHGLIGSGPVSPLLTDYTYILPTSGSFEEYARSGTEESFKIRLEPTGPVNTFQTVRIAFPNTGAAYTVERVYLMRSGNANTAITEDPATGVVTVSGAPFVVPAGTDENPTWHEIAVSVSVGPVSDFVLLIDVASGSPRSDWGSGPYRGLGWIFGGNEKLTQNLTAGINFTGGESFGSMPPVRVKFEGLSTPVLWLPFVGDSWVYGYGDGPGPWRPYGIEGRLNGRWDAFNQPIAVMGYGRSGYTTDQSLTRLQNLLTNFDCRAACVQFNSLNNVLQSLPDTQCRTDWVGVETAMGTRKILPLVGGGMLDAFAPGWFTAWKANSDWMVARNADTNVDVYDNLVSPTTGVIGGGLAYSDDSHPNADGYDTWETDCNANMRAAIAGWGV